MKSTFANRLSILLGLSLLALRASAATNSISAGQTTNGIIALGQTNFYSFTANSNDTVTLLVATDAGGTPSAELQGSNGVVLAATSGNIWPGNATFLDTIRLTNDGAYLVLVHDVADNQSYDYGLTLVKNPGPNSASAGGAILPGQTVTNRLTGPGVMHVYSFTASSNDTVTVLAATGAGGTYPDVELQGPNGVVLAAAAGSIWPSSAAFIDSIRVTNDGTYLILVRDDQEVQSYDYGLTLVKNPGPNSASAGGVILPGQTVTNRLTGPGVMHVYSFTASSNDTVTVLAATGAGGTYPDVELQGPNGVVLAAAAGNIWPSSAAFIDSIRVTNDGTYLILVRDDQEVQSYDYGLTLVKNPGPNSASAGGAILPGQTVTNRLTGPGVMHVYSFTASSNDTVTVLAATDAGGTYPDVELQGPNGVVLAAAAGNLWPYNAAFLDSIRVTNDGTYLILVRDDQEVQSYDYGLTLVKNPGPNAADFGETNVIHSGETVAGAIVGLADMDAYSFNAIVGDTIAVALEITGGIGQYPVLQLYSPDGSVLRNASGSTSAALWYLCVPQTGSYAVTVRAGYETFNYSLSLSQTPGFPPTNTPPEYLQACNCSNQVLVRWSTNAIGFRLQTSEQLTSPPATTIWSNIPLPYNNSGDFNFTTNGFPPGRKFFRLVKP